MKTTELENELCELINRAILRANRDEKTCECGKIILDADKTAAVLKEVMDVAVERLAAFLIVASDPDVRLHLPESNDPAKPATHLH